MGHAINYLRVNEKKDIMPAAERFAAYNVDREEDPSGSYHGNMTILDMEPFRDFQSAVDYIDSKGGFYKDYAVRFYDTDELKDTAAITKLKERIKKNNEMQAEYFDKADVTKQKSNFITCSNCKSKINKEYIRNSECSACRHSLLSTTVKNRIQKFDDDNEKMMKQIQELKNANYKKAKIKWCVKVEVHC